MKVVALESASRCAKMRNWFPVLTVLAIIITVPVSSGGAQERPIECCDQVRTPFNDAEVEALDLDDGELFMVPMALIDVGGVGALLGGSSLKATLSDPQTRAKVYSEAVLSAIAAEELSRLEPVAARGPDASDMISAFSTVSSQASDASGIASDVTSGIRAVEAADAARRAGTSISAAQAAEAARFKSSLLGRGSTALGRLTLAANLASNFDDASDRAAFLGEAIRDARISGALSDFEAVLRASPGHDPAMVQGVVDAQTRLTQLSDSRLRRMAEAGAAAFDANQATIAGLVLAKVVSGGAAMVASEVMQLGVSLDDFTAQTISIAAMHNLSAASLAQVKMIADEDTSMLDERELGEIDVRRLGAFQAQLAAEANAATYNLLWTDRWDEPLSFAGLGKALGMTAAEAGSASEDLQERYRDLVAERARTQVDLWIAALPKVGNGGNPSANTGSGISRTSDRVEITGSADSTFLSEVVEVKLGAPVNVVDWREIAEKFEKDGPDFLQPFANEDGKVSGLGVTLDGDPSYSSNRFYFVAVGPVHSNFLSHEIARFGNETLHLGSWYGPYRYLYRTAVDDSREEVEGALGEANAIDDVEQESSQVDWSNATPIKVFESSEIITVSDFSPAGNAFAVATVEGSWADDHSRAGIAYILDAKSRKKLISITGHTDRIIDLAFSNSGSYLITTSEDKTARVWDASTGREKHRLEHKSWVRSAAFSPDDKRVVTVSDGTITIWEISTGRIVEQFPGGESVENAAYSPNGRFIVTSSNDLNTQYAQIWDAYTVEKIVSITGHDDKILYANFSPSGKTVVTTSRDASARIWNARNGNQLGVLSGHENAVIHASFSSDGRFVATSSSDMTARIWDTETGKEVAILEGHGLNSDYIRPVSSVTFAPGRHAVLTSSEDGTALIWSSESE